MSDLMIMFDYYASEYEKYWASEYGQSCKIIARAYLKAIEIFVNECY